MLEHLGRRHGAWRACRKAAILSRFSGPRPLGTPEAGLLDRDRRVPRSVGVLVRRPGLIWGPTDQRLHCEVMQPLVPLAKAGAPTHLGLWHGAVVGRDGSGGLVMRVRPTDVAGEEYDDRNGANHDDEDHRADGGRVV